MKDKRNQIRKVCGFYVNEWHLTTMILPYIRNEVNKENKVITILQNDMKPKIEEILFKMNVNKTLENKILEIEWNKTQPIKYSKIKQKLLTTNGQAQNINIIISGDKEFIKTGKESLEKAIQNSNIQNQITMICFYDITQFTNVSEITKEYEYILNTSGIRKVEEVFKKEEKKDA